MNAGAPDHSMTDETLIARAQAGDSSAILELYECYKQQIYRYLYYRLDNRQSAEDLTTEVFIRVIQNLPDFRPQRGTVQAWIFQIARNLSIDHMRKRKVRSHVSLNEYMADPGVAPDIAAERSLTIDRLQDALQHLTDGQRDVILLRFIDGLSIAEVSQLLNKTESSVKNLQLRGLKALNGLLSPQSVIHE